MRTIVIPSTILIVLLTSLNVLFAGGESCDYSAVIEEDSMDCLCESLVWHVCAGTGAVRVSYECSDDSQCAGSEECVKIGEGGNWFLAYAQPQCHSTHEDAPFCAFDDDCEIESLVHAEWILQPICQCMTP